MSWKDEARAGLNDIWPAALAAVPIGLLFGALAAGKGLSPLEVFLMSVLVFAGGAQFAAVMPPMATVGISITSAHQESSSGSALWTVSLVVVGKKAPKAT